LERLKLIWDFRGPDAQKIAEHHEIHLKEYIANKAITQPITGTEELSEMHYSAFLIVNREEMKPVRDDLRPHRGTLYTQRN